MMRHATSYWRQLAKQGDEVYGRVINTTSEAALFASAGQPNYAAAKAGIIALTLAGAQAMLKYGATMNAIAPRARTRMTDSAFPGMMDAPEGGFDTFSVDNVTGLVGYLASPRAQRVTGQVFIVWGNQVSVLAGPSVEERFETDGRWEADALADALEPFYERRELLSGYAIPQG
jgi:3-oxoacyl-[acyl-carrier protein] reductase